MGIRGFKNTCDLVLLIVLSSNIGLCCSHTQSMDVDDSALPRLKYQQTNRRPLRGKFLKSRANRGVPTCMQIRMCVQLDATSIGFSGTAKSVFKSGHSKIDKKILTTNGSSMEAESITECFLQYFGPALSDNRS